MRTILKGFLVLLAFKVQAAPLYFEITGGQSTGIPIAIVPFAVDGSVNASESITSIIRHNLQNSGQFRPILPDEMRQRPSVANEVDYEYWRAMDVEYLVVGKITSQTRKTVDVQFELLGVFKPQGRGGVSAGNTMRASFEYKGVGVDQLRILSHRISDEIFEKLLGVKGVFSTRIAYISVEKTSTGTEHQLIVADADGYNPRVIKTSTQPLMSPAWSPDGKRLAYVSFEGAHASIEVADLSTGQRKVVSRYKGINGAPSWSPDGEKLAIVLSKDGSPDIYLLDLATYQLTKLTDNQASNTEPYWAKDGQSIVFTSNRGGKPQIYRLWLRTRETERLTFQGDYNARPSLTSDGKQLVMMHRDNMGRFQIAALSLKTGKLRCLTKTAYDESPSLAPNGMMVLYGSQEAGGSVLGAVSLDGRFRMRLPAPSGSVQEPAWSPFL